MNPRRRRINRLRRKWVRLTIDGGGHVWMTRREMASCGMPIATMTKGLWRLPS
jgi:hypothetical protein